MQAHEGALDVQITAFGAAISGSSSAPARITTSSGRSAELLKICVPQVGQKLRTICAPLSAVLLYLARFPFIVTPLVGTMMLLLPLPHESV